MANPQTSFESILDMPATEVERPKPVPAGSYHCVVQGMPEHGESAKKKTPFVKFTLALQSAGEDVEADELEAYGGLEGKTIKTTYYTTPDSLFRLTDFLEHCGIELEGKSIRAALDETTNCSVGCFVSHRASEDGQQVFAEVKSTFKID